MRRGGFLMTTVATGLLVAGLMTVGRAGLQSHGVLFLQGQMKIVAGDTDTGLKLLAQAAGSKAESTSAPSAEKASAAEVKVCTENKKTAAAAKTAEKVPMQPKWAPEPSLASVAVNPVPMPPMVRTSYMQDAMPFLPTAQREAIRAQQKEIERARRIREKELQKVLKHVSFESGPTVMPNPAEIQAQIQKELGHMAQ